MKNILKQIALLVFAAVLCGCASRTYYAPQKDEVNGKRTQDYKISSSIIQTTRDGATLDNGQFITKSGEVSFYQLPKNSYFLNDSNGYYLASEPNALLILEKSTSQIERVALPQRPISASVNGNLIATLLSNNTILIFDLLNKTEKYRLDGSAAASNNTLIANPYFLSDIIIVPTLDGKLVIVDSTSMKMVRNIVVNSDNQFNNVIFLQTIDTRMVAATPKRVISVSPSVINTMDTSVKDILFLGKKIIIFTAEGEIVMTDEDLNKIKSVKFPFARFSAPNAVGTISVLEKGGYMIIMDDELENRRILSTQSVDEPSFAAGGKTFVGNRVYNIR